MENLLLIAGPCAVESKEQIIRIAKKLKDLGITYLRGGAFKPRTNPESFQGLGDKGIEYLIEAKKVPETLNEIEIVDAAEIYKSVTKKIISIKHKYVQQEALLYDKAVKEVEGSRVSKKRRIFDN